MFTFIFLLVFHAPVKFYGDDRSIPIQEKQNKGKELYQSKCIKCHSLKNPLLTSKTKWEKVFPRMARKAKLTPEETTIIKNYIFSFDLE